VPDVNASADAFAAPPPPPQTLFRRHRIKIVAFGVLIVAAGILALWTMAALKFSYASGDRVGYVQKLSRRGWICRTWEGELAMNPVPGSAPQLFQFTIPDPTIAKNIDDLEGKHVSIHFEEKRGLPSSCFGETREFITSVRVLPQ
jgi:hypothetical protein